MRLGGWLAFDANIGFQPKLHEMGARRKHIGVTLTLTD